MSIFGFIKKVVELPLNVAHDVVVAPKKVLDLMGDPMEDTNLLRSTTNKLGEILDEMEE